MRPQGCWSRRVLLLASALLLAAPSIAAAKEKITFTAKGSAKHDAKPEDCEIQVFQGEELPTSPYVEIGVVNYHDEQHRMNSGSLNFETALKRLRARSCAAGADALINIRVTEVRRLEAAMFNVRATAVRFESR
jgi:hypothetical protein